MVEEKLLQSTDILGACMLYAHRLVELNNLQNSTHNTHSIHKKQATINTTWRHHIYHTRQTTDITKASMWYKYR